MAKKTVKKGVFITFEGPEGSGKSTHAKLLFKYLKNKGYNCVFTREPGGTPVGNKIRKILLREKKIKINDICELFLFEANRSQLTNEVIHPALKKGRIIICDRFYDATVAYQGFGAGLNIRLVKELNKLASKGIKPDLTVLLDVETKKGLKRSLRKGESDRVESKPTSFHQRVRRGYLKLAKTEYKRIKVFKSDRAIQKTQEDIRRIVEKCLSRI